MAGKLPGDLQFVSLHGTGTPLGDPIEVGALGPALSGDDSNSGHHITLGQFHGQEWTRHLILLGTLSDYAF